MGSKAPYKALDVANYIVGRTHELNNGVCISKDVANYIIGLPEKLNNGVLMSNLRIQRVLYFVQLFYLRDTGTVFFADDIEAWKYGPVVPTVYKNFSVFGAMPIMILQQDWEAAKKAISQEDQAFIDSVLEKTKGFKYYQLIDITRNHRAWISSYWNIDHTITLDKLLKEANRGKK